MGEYNTGNPVPSSAMPDVWDNNATIDEFVNSPELTLTTRTGTERDTLAGIQKKSDDQRVQMAEDGAAVVEETRQNLIPLSRQYMTLAEAQADIVNIPVGSTTYYRSPDDSALAVEVINNAGTLEPTGRKMPSQASVDSASEKATLALESVPVERVLPELVPVVQDSVGKVALWLEDGDLNGKGVTREFADKSAAASSIVTGISEMVPSESVTPQLVPVVQDAEGKVSIWLENG
ncbi:TPA: GDSL family lipase, partial [Klebsiella pneumoniae]